MESVPWYRKTLLIPKVKQKLNFSCGAVALRAIAKYYDTAYGNEEDFIRLCRTNRDGTCPNNLIRAANKIDLKAKSYENMSLDLLKRLLDQNKPVIVAIQAYGKTQYQYDALEAGHYVIAIGYTSQRFIFEDPYIQVSKRGYMYYNDFSERWQDLTTRQTRLFHFGIAIWKRSKPVNQEIIKGLRRIT